MKSYILYILEQKLHAVSFTVTWLVHKGEMRTLSL